MAINTEQVTVAICDQCSKRVYGDPGIAPAALSGTVTDETAGKGVTAKWAACRPAHVGGAVVEALKKTNLSVKPIQPVSSPSWGSAAAS